MGSGWKVRVTLQRITDQYRASVLTYRELENAREEKAELFMADSREAALELARDVARQVGARKLQIDDQTSEAAVQARVARNKLEFEPRLLRTPALHIDTNLINAKQKLTSINKLEKWAADEVIVINMSSIAHGEAQADGNPLRTRKANEQIFTATSPERDDLHRRIAEALFPKGIRNQNQENDVSIVREASKYGAILVTADGGSKSQPGGILGNRDKLKAL
jgi:hypothetical protein